MSISDREAWQRASLERVLLKMDSLGFDAFVVTDLPSIRWLTGFSGSSARLLLTPRASWLFTDSRYRVQARDEVRVVEPVIDAEGFVAALHSGRYPLGGCVALQSDRVSWHEATRIIAAVDERCRVVPVDGFFDEFRMIKSPGELLLMQRAADISCQVLGEVIPMISSSMSECDIAAEISCRHRKLGAQKDSFDPIVASGPRGAMPHAQPSDAHFEPGALIVIDMGCMVDGYASDQTRTVGLGPVCAEAKEVYGIVLEAQQLGVRSARCGMRASELDGIVRSFIAGHGYGDAFGHGLGHGIGLEVHEGLHISPKGETVLQEGMVFTIEPGIYLEGKFGVRIEDTVVMEAGRARSLQNYPREL
ncbi:MAG TPA: peptidase M24 [Chlorobium sp.]|uniref:Peptidase M24 n=1 Tax=Chlorobium phaeovibrioides (strain DSM 265 / 1930) TaxID=290318 RepID=A4SFZ5_CHLPM|nr:peptidase M24 [Chlorobium sp.]